MGMRGGLMVWGRGVRASIALTARALAIVGAIVLAGCGDLGLNPQPLFTTPLSIDDLAGFPRVVTTGGLEAEPITEDDTERLQEAGIVEED